MSTAARSWATAIPIRRAATKAILMALADHAREADDAQFPFLCWPSISTLVDETGHDRKTVMAAIAQLQEHDLITDTGKKVGRTAQIPVYRVNFDTVIPACEQSQKRNSTGNGTVPFFTSNSTVFSDKEYRFFRLTVPKTVHGTVIESSREPKVEPSGDITRDAPADDFTLTTPGQKPRTAKPDPDEPLRSLLAAFRSVRYPELAPFVESEFRAFRSNLVNLHKDGRTPDEFRRATAAAMERYESPARVNPRSVIAHFDALLEPRTASGKPPPNQARSSLRPSVEEALENTKKTVVELVTRGNPFA